MANVPEVLWGDDPLAEAVLHEEGVNFWVEKVPLEAINFFLSDGNPGRLEEKLDPDRVAQYATEMLDGDRFPRPVLRRLGDGRYFIIGGRHRCGAAQEIRNNAKVIEAYVTDLDDGIKLALLPVKLNIHHGVGLDKDAKLEKALYLVDKFHFTQEAAAAEYDIKPKTFQAFYRGRAITLTLEKMEIEATKLRPHVLQRLHGVANRNTLRALAELFISHPRLPEDRKLEIIRDADAKDTEQAQLDCVAAYAQALTRPPKKVDQRLHVRNRLFRLLDGVVTFLQAQSDAAGCQVASAQDREDVHARVRTIVRRSRELFGEPQTEGDAPAAPAAPAARPAEGPVGPPQGGTHRGAQPGQPAGNSKPVQERNHKGARGRRTSHSG